MYTKIIFANYFVIKMQFTRSNVGNNIRIHPITSKQLYQAERLYAAMVIVYF